MPFTYVYLAGINNSGPQHWQRLWQEQQGGLWIEHANWDAPICSHWVEEMDEALVGVKGPIILVAHSLGCLLAAQWLAQGGQAAAAYFVAVPDPNGKSFPKQAGGFNDPMLLNLRIPVRMVASKDDPYSSLGFAFDLADRWKAGFWDLGAKGHINASSGLGTWPEGWQDMQHFLGGIQA